MKLVIEPSETNGRRSPRLRAWLATLARCLASAFVWIQLSLAASALVLGAFFQHRIVLIEGGSMEPALSAGDIVALSAPKPNEDIVGLATTFRTSAGIVTHRIVETNADGTHVTHGDANLKPDAQPLNNADMVGVVRRIVPWVGLPVFWLRHGHWLALGAWATVTMGASLFGCTRRLPRLSRSGESSPRVTAANGRPFSAAEWSLDR